jgi:hypothetical protein
LLIVDARSGAKQKRKWSTSELTKGVSWLKRMNAKGHDVFVRPDGAHGLVLIDDLSKETLATMRKKGFEPASTIQTSPGRFQAWVKLSDHPLSDPVREQAVLSLEHAFGKVERKR